MNWREIGPQHFIYGIRQARREEDMRWKKYLEARFPVGDVIMLCMSLGRRTVPSLFGNQYLDRLAFVREQRRIDPENVPGRVLCKQLFEDQRTGKIRLFGPRLMRIKGKLQYA